MSKKKDQPTTTDQPKDDAHAPVPASAQPEHSDSPTADSPTTGAPTTDSPALDPTSPEVGERILAAWADGSLVLPIQDSGTPVPLPGRHYSAPLPEGLAGGASVDLIGIGERFVVWRLEPEDNAPLAVRIPHVPPQQRVQALQHEIAALTHMPRGLGPSPVSSHEDPATSPIGLAYVAVTFESGEPLAPESWNRTHLRIHAQRLARLHTVIAPGRGPIAVARDPWAEVPERPLSVLDEVDALLATWRRDHADVLSAHSLEPFLDAMRERVVDLDAQMRSVNAFCLVHGDLCATNILWRTVADGYGGTEPVPVFIDLEWAQADDPARDLSSIGGTIHGGPWYVPMDEDLQTAFVTAYLKAREDLPMRLPSPGSPRAVRERMLGWAAYERTAMLVHLAVHQDQDSPHRQMRRDALPLLRVSLAQEFGLKA